MILLASQSSGRLATLRAAGVEPLVRVSDVDEHAVLRVLAADSRQEPTPVQQVQALARAKAEEVAAAVTRAEREADPSLVVVGCDSMLEIDGRVVGKPGTSEIARARWRSMRGRTGVLHSGHALVRVGNGARAGGVSSTTVRFGSPTDAEIDAYVATGEPLGCAGAFTIDGLGGAFIDGIDGDPHGVVGISLPLLRRLLADLDVRWTDLWVSP
ncbi:nucleoside triphosphate pyrophosphatase [Actinomyces gerencseriae]|uniref:Maf family protein n=1 Tax=Actinomyces gerencseriae TaxID=52769 RepID=UPI000400FD37|nr:nucleoside triphosphate pyrophosphatase [Actinomyces gerencseriae]